MISYLEHFSAFIEKNLPTFYDTFSVEDMIGWVQNREPERKPQNIKDHLLKRTTNYESRDNFVPPSSSADDLFFVIEPNLFRRYQPGVDPPPFHSASGASADRFDPKFQTMRLQQKAENPRHFPTQQHGKAVAPTSSDSVLQSELSEGLRLTIENMFPYPIAKPFDQLRALYDWRTEIPQLANILGATIEYLAIIALAEYGALKTKSPAISERFATDFKKPLSHGSWAGVLRTVLNYIRQQDYEPTVAQLPLQYRSSGTSIENQINELIPLRNELIKKSGERTPTRTEHSRFKRGLVNLLRELSFLKDYPLVTATSSYSAAGVKWHECYSQMGCRGQFERIRIECDLDIDANRVAILNFKKKELLYLHPFYLTRECPVCSVVHLFRFDSVKKNKVEYIGPDGHNLTDGSAALELIDVVSGRSSTGAKKSARYLSTESTPSQEESFPSRLGNYKILCPIRPGGMADIYRAESLEDGRNYALKLLPYRFFRDKTLVRRFRSEANHALSLRHPNIVHVFDYGEELPDYYLVMELAPGWQSHDRSVALDVGDLKKPINLATALSIIKQACEGLDYIHQNQIIHRDIKPSNLLLFDEDTVKISDFGIARSPEAITLTMTGLNVGTPEYSSPEQADGQHELTFASDIYSLGVVMFELLTGVSPFKRATPMSTLLAHMNEKIPDPTSFSANIPKSLARIVTTCLQKDPQKRYTTARALLGVLHEYEELQTTGEHPRERSGLEGSQRATARISSHELPVGKNERGSDLQYRAKPILRKAFQVEETVSPNAHAGRIVTATLPQRRCRVQFKLKGKVIHTSPEYTSRNTWAKIIAYACTRRGGAPGNLPTNAVAVPQVLTSRGWTEANERHSSAEKSMSRQGGARAHPQSPSINESMDSKRRETRRSGLDFSTLKPNIAPGTRGTDNLFRGIKDTAAAWLRKNEALAIAVYNKVAASGAAGISGAQLNNHPERQAAYRLAIVGKIRANTLDKDLKPNDRRYHVK